MTALAEIVANYMRINDRVYEVWCVDNQRIVRTKKKHVSAEYVDLTTRLCNLRHRYYAERSKEPGVLRAKIDHLDPLYVVANSAYSYSFFSARCPSVGTFDQRRGITPAEKPPFTRADVLKNISTFDNNNNRDIDIDDGQG